MPHLDLILAHHHAREIRLSLVGDVLPSGPLSERISVDRGDVDHLSERLSTELLDQANRPAQAGAGPPLSQTLAQSGLALYQALFGPAGDVLRRLKHQWDSQERYCVLHLDEELVHIPVELCHDGDAFLCETFLIGRRVAASRADRLTAPKPADPPRVVILVNPSEDPCLGDSAEEELKAIRKSLAEGGAAVARPYVGRVIDRRLLDQTLPGSAVVHFIGHADSAPERPEQSGWRLLGNRWYGPDRVLRLQNPPAIVFANACATARAADWNRSTTLVRAFLERGTQAYIGTWWEVASPAAARFAGSFYRSLTSGRSVGRALASARRALVEALGPDEASWAGYVLYGDPRTRWPGRERPGSPSVSPRRTTLVASIVLALGVLVPSTLDEWPRSPVEEDQPSERAVGYLTFESNPTGALVRVDGQPRGTTPCTLELEAGGREITLELAGHRVWEASTVVDPEHPQVIRAQMEENP